MGSLPDSGGFLAQTPVDHPRSAFDSACALQVPDVPRRAGRRQGTQTVGTQPP